MSKTRLTVLGVVTIALSVIMTIQTLSWCIPLGDRTSLDGIQLNVEGEINLTVIPVFFPDLDPTLPPANISADVFNNISEYFTAQSYGKMMLVGEVRQWTMAPNNLSFYDRGSLQSSDPAIQANASLGVKLFRDDILNRFIWSNANFTKHILLLYAGYNTIHPHHRSMTILVDGKATSCEISVAPELANWGTIAHEIAHGFGLNDLYNIYTFDECIGSLVGSYCLMANEGSGFRINDMCAYSKVSLGWITIDEVIHIDNDTDTRLLSIDQSGVGIRVARIPIDKWRYYLVEARGNENNYGVLISRVDRSRPEGGYGRLEVVRSVRGTSDIQRSTFWSGQSFIDDEHGISVRVVQQDGPFYDIEVRFGSLDFPRQVECPLGIGRIVDSTSVIDLNGTTYFAFCALNETSTQHVIHIYSLSDHLEHIANTSYANDSINPVLVSGNDGILLIYETIKSSSHSVCAQFGDLVMPISGSEDSRNPTAACSGNGLYVAYENRSTDNPSIIVMKGNQCGWKWGITFLPERIVPNSEYGVPHTPLLYPANNYAALAYLRTNNSYSVLELVWDINSMELAIRFDNFSVRDYSIAALTEYRLLISVSSTGEYLFTNVFYWKGLYGDLTQIASFSGETRSTECLLGVWQGLITKDEFRFTEVWDRWYRSSGCFALALNDSILIDSGFCSFFGSTGLYTITVSGEVASLEIWSIISTGQGAELGLFSMLWNLSIEILLWIVLSAAIYFHIDQFAVRVIRKRLARRSSNSSGRLSIVLKNQVGFLGMLFFIIRSQTLLLLRQLTTRYHKNQA